MFWKSKIPQFFVISVSFHLLVVISSFHFFRVIKLNFPREKILTPIGVYVKYKRSSPEKSVALPTKTKTQRKNINKKNLLAKQKSEKKPPTIQQDFNAGNSKTGVERGEAGEPDGIQVAIKERFKYDLKLFIENNKEYPRLAQKQGQEGQVKVSFVINRDGTITNVKLLETCPFTRLNKATVNFFKRYSVFKEIPNEINEDKMELTYLIDYRLY